jgi:hypothetical protein
MYTPDDLRGMNAMMPAVAAAGARALCDKYGPLYEASRPLSASAASAQ